MTEAERLHHEDHVNSLMQRHAFEIAALAEELNFMHKFTNFAQMMQGSEILEYAAAGMAHGNDTVRLADLLRVTLDELLEDYTEYVLRKEHEENGRDF